ncbi:conserved exported hypothetical protein [Paraburkholderia tropica]|uniref:hypothetical protein n=1 Tax=Paraburkholderia TaxID=1822464 RepID=UPI001CB29A7B|nr:MULTISPECIES: hypothetical protein [Paraburkholderia]CAG9227066.1 conserved exported hypothetical protein [Paraburkholderia tropica]
MKRLLLAALAAASIASIATGAHAQSNTPGPVVTPGGTVQFVRDDRDFVAMLNNDIFDRFDAKTLTHFDEVARDNETVTRMLVQTAFGPVLYDFSRRPPLVQRANARLTVKRVFWQRGEVVMQGTDGWYRIQDGKLTKLQSTKSIYH